MPLIANTPPRRKAPDAAPPAIDERQQRIDAYMATHRKSPLIAFLLAFFFGPLGYFYTSIVGAVVLLLVTIALAAVPEFLAVAWILAMVAAPLETLSINKKRRAEAELMAGR